MKFEAEVQATRTVGSLPRKGGENRESEHDDANDKTEKPQRTGSPAFAEDDSDG